MEVNNMTFPVALNEVEKEAIEELRMLMEKTLPSDLFDDTLMFYRFLKARDFNVEKARIMLKKHISWRKAFQVDTILENFKPSEVASKYLVPSFIGFDKDGNIVRYLPSGKIESKNVLKCIKMNDVENVMIYFMEKTISLLKAENEKTGRNNYQGSIIFNLDELTFANATSKESTEFFLRLLHLIQDNYPERMRCFYVINAPTYYIFLFSILRSFMSNAMIRKINVFGRNGWKEVLLKIIDADILPAFLGGNRTDPDGNPLCLTFMNHGGKIPSKYYLSDEQRWFKDKSRVTIIQVRPMEKEKVLVEVKEAGSLIQWEFRSKNKDIGFGLFFQNQKEEVEVLPIYRYVTTDGTKTGFYKSQSTGIYAIIFDNSYSWLSSKEVHYCVMVTKHEL